MARRLTLICHGATAATRAGAFSDDEPVEAKAVAQAQALAPYLRRADRALVSPALRARQTARGLGLFCQMDEGLRDWDSGRWRGRSLTDIQDQEPDALMAWRHEADAAPHGGESLNALVARVAHWLAQLDMSAGHVVAVTHSAVVRAVVLTVLEAPVSAFWRIDAAQLGLTDVRTDGTRWTLRALGQKPLRGAAQPAADAARSGED